MTAVTIRRADGVLTVQDMGRPGHLAQGLSRGGAMDRLALIEAAALLGAASMAIYVCHTIFAAALREGAPPGGSGSREAPRDRPTLGRQASLVR